MKLELSDLAPYLPYGVHLMNGYGNWHNTTLHKSISIYEMLEMKPILRPMSDLRKYKNGDFIFIIEEVENINEGVKELKYSTVTFLLSKHFDVFGLIDKEFAIDINTLSN